MKRPEASELAKYKPGALVIAIMDPYGNDEGLEAMAEAGMSAFAMELLPRITRAQSMDVLSSQANLAGYRAVIDAAELRPRLPMMMTAAARSPRPRCSSWASASPACRRSRPRGGSAPSSPRPTCAPPSRSRSKSRRQILAVEDEEFKQAETAGGYAKEMAKHISQAGGADRRAHQKQDIVITTALIPGRPAPRLVTADMVDR